MATTLPQSSSDKRTMTIAARGHGQGVRSMARNLFDWTRSAGAALTFLSAEAPTTFLAMGTRYPRTMRRRHRRPDTFRLRFWLPVQVGNRQAASATFRGEICKDEGVNALLRKELPRCAG